MEKKVNMLSSIFSWVTKVTKDVWVCVPPLQQKNPNRVSRVFLTLPIIYIVRFKLISKGGVRASASLLNGSIGSFMVGGSKTKPQC